MNYLKSHWGSVCVIAIIIILSAVGLLIDLNAIKETIANAGIWAPILYILAKSSTVILAPLSGTALYVFSVPLFGFWNGVMYSFIGDLIGAVVTFYISRFFGRPVVSYFTGKKNMVHIEGALEVMATLKGFISMRLAAVSMPEIASYAAGLTSIKFSFFITLHMLIGIIPIIVISLPGLFFTQYFPGWVIIVGVILAVVVTIASIWMFVYMLKRATKKVAEERILKESESTDFV